MLAVIAVATVAAIGVIAYHIEGPTELLAKPHAFVKHGQLVHPIHIAPLPVHFNVQLALYATHKRTGRRT